MDEIKIVSMEADAVSVLSPAGAFLHVSTDLDVDDVAITILTDYSEEVEVGRQALAEVTAQLHQDRTLTGGDQTTAEIFDRFLKTHEATETVKGNAALLAEFRQLELAHLQQHQGLYSLGELVQRCLALPEYDIALHLLSWPAEYFATTQLRAAELCAKGGRSLLHGCCADLLNTLYQRCTDTQEDFVLAHASLALDPDNEPAKDWIASKIKPPSGFQLLADCDRNQATGAWLLTPGLDALYARNPYAVQLLFASEAQRRAFDQPKSLAADCTQALAKLIQKHHRVAFRGQELELPYEAHTTVGDLRVQIAAALSVDSTSIWLVSEDAESLEQTVAELAQLDPGDLQRTWSPQTAKAHFAQLLSSQLIQKKGKEAVKLFNQFGEKTRWTTREVVTLVAEKMRQLGALGSRINYDDSARVCSLPKLIIAYMPEGHVVEEQALEIDPRWCTEEASLEELD